MWTNFWTDFNKEHNWRFPEVAPTRLEELLGFPVVDSAERIRAEWMWRRKPKLILGDGVCGYCLVVCIAVAFLLVPRTGILLDLIWLIVSSLLVVSDTTRSNRWRQDYEASIDRLIRSSKKKETNHPDF
jgi:hypothetical protein